MGKIAKYHKERYKRMNRSTSCIAIETEKNVFPRLTTVVHGGQTLGELGRAQLPGSIPSTRAVLRYIFISLSLSHPEAHSRLPPKKAPGGRINMCDIR